MQTAEERLERNRANQKRQRERKRRYLNAVKTAIGCEECGYNVHPCTLHFDHIDPTTKLFGIGDVRASMTKMIAEIAKCRVLCANCHSLHSYEEKHFLLAK